MIERHGAPPTLMFHCILIYRKQMFGEHSPIGRPHQLVVGCRAMITNYVFRPKRWALPPTPEPSPTDNRSHRSEIIIRHVRKAHGPQHAISDVQDMHVRHVRKALGPQHAISDVQDMHVRHVRKALGPQHAISGVQDMHVRHVRNALGPQNRSQPEKQFTLLLCYGSVRCSFAWCFVGGYRL
jgi:hypothetical protein